MIQKHLITIPELTGKEERRLYIYLPVNYERNGEKRYPVLYMFDGHNVFYDGDATYGRSWRLGEYLDATVTDLIVVAVECNHSPDHGRLREYSPYDFSSRDVGEIKGYGKITMDWMVNTLKPMVDRNYRTKSDRDNTWIAGSSMGGLMTIYAVMKYNHVFGKGAALSPSLHLVYEKMSALIRNARISANTVLYVDYGSGEMYRRKKMREQFGDIISSLITKGVYVESRIVPWGQHCEASWGCQVPFFMNTLMYKWEENE